MLCSCTVRLPKSSVDQGKEMYNKCYATRLTVSTEVKLVAPLSRGPPEPGRQLQENAPSVTWEINGIQSLVLECNVGHSNMGKTAHTKLAVRSCSGHFSQSTFTDNTHTGIYDSVSTLLGEVELMHMKQWYQAVLPAPPVITNSLGTKLHMSEVTCMAKTQVANIPAEMFPPTAQSVRG